MKKISPVIWITANQRLALYVPQQHDQALDCLSLKNWLIQTYHNLPDAKLLLNEQQELALWENIIARTLRDGRPELALLSARDLAQKAQDAWHLLKGWDVPLNLLAQVDSEEVSEFYHWARAFEKTCREKNFIDLSTCVEHLIVCLLQKKIILPKQIILAGFEEIPPQTQRLFDVLFSQCELHFHDASIRATNLEKVGLENEEIELLAMAQWAYKLQAKNPHVKIGCVVPNLSSIRHDVERIFNDVFASKPIFNISGGYSLNIFPIVKTAFDILQLDAQVLDVRQLSRLLASPFLGGAEQEFVARAALDMQMLEIQESCMHWEKMIFLAEKREDCAIWVAQCHRYLMCVNEVDDEKPAHAWAKHFMEQLQCMGWPGERSLNSSEYQQVKRWQLLLEEFSQLEVVLEKSLSRKKALRYLYHLAQVTMFQPETTSETSVQVLGLLEAVGLSFDYLWVSGMTQEDWPSHALPNPFIPIILQRNHNMSHASPERELIYSRALTQRFCQSAHAVIFSYALQKEDRPQAASVLISDIKDALTEKFYQPSSIHFDKNLLEYFTDEYGPPFSSEKILRGGANIFKYQSACPFKAFAHMRLGAAGMPIFTFGMTLQERGVCLHHALEKIWKKLKDHQTLCQYDEKALDQLVQSVVHQVLSDIAKKRVFTLRSRFVALEKQRLVAQIKAWLVFEKQRPPFRVVALESVREVQFAELMLKLRADREDELEDGARLMIDYKTGECHVASWFGDRPDDPQLPLYSLTCDHSIGGLIFAQISADKLQFVGVSDRDCGINNVDTIGQKKMPDLPTWDAFLSASKTTLTRLAKEFQNGYAKVDPKQLEKTCRGCDLQSLCRVHERKM